MLLVKSGLGIVQVRGIKHDKTLLYNLCLCFCVIKNENLRNEKEKPLPRSLTAMGLRGDGLREEVVSTPVYYASSGAICFVNFFKRLVSSHKTW